MCRDNGFVFFCNDLNVYKGIVYFLGMFYFGYNNNFVGDFFFLNGCNKIRNYLIVCF